jgi:hypothetical protein
MIDEKTNKMHNRAALIVLAIALILTALLSGELRAQDINIEDRTGNECALLYANIIARDLLEFDTLNVIIIPLPKSSTLEGAVERDQTRAHTYTLLMNQSLSIKRLRLMMCHEFIHIKQYEHEGLNIFGDIWDWNGDWGSMTFTEYHHRTFEIDANERQFPLNKELTRELKRRQP